MTVFSKILNKHINPKMWIFGDLYPPLGLTGFFGAFIVCCISFYLFKKISAEANVPVRDSTKNHNWTSIKVISKVSKETRCSYNNITLNKL